MIAKIYQNQFGTEVLGIIDEINEFKIDLNINWGSRWELIVNSDWLPILRVSNKWDDNETWNDTDIWQDFVSEWWARPYNKVEFYEVEWWQDILIFSWYIYNLKLTLTWYIIELRDENDLMNKKLVLSDKTYNSQTPLQILNDISSDWETETWENWQIVSSVSDTITIDFKKWDTFYTVLNELSQQLGYNWNIKNQIISFNEVVWEDKSSGVNFEEIVYNGIDHSEDNITNINLEYYWNIANLIIWWDNTNKILLKDLDKRWAIGEYVGFYDWNLTEQTQRTLDLKSQELFNYTFEVQLFKTNINLWDKIFVRIENSNWLDFYWTVIVNKVKLELTNAVLLKNIEVETSVMKRNLLTTRLEGIERNVALLLK